MDNATYGAWGRRLFDGHNGDVVALAPLDQTSSFAPSNKPLALMGCDGYYVCDERVNNVDMAREYLGVVQGESCGKCVPCCMGTRVAADILARLCESKGREEDLAALRSVPGLLGGTLHLTTAPINAVTDDAVDPVRKIPEYKVCAVRPAKVIPAQETECGKAVFAEEATC